MAFRILDKQSNFGRPFSLDMRFLKLQALILDCWLEYLLLQENLE